MINNIEISDYVKRLLNIGIALTAEKDYNKLLEKILSEARSITNADGGTLYIVENNKLHYKIMQTSSLNIYKGGSGEAIPFPPVEMIQSNVSAYCALTKSTINIPDVYHSDLFDFSGPKKFDSATGYVTKSMLVIPLINRDDKVIGVLQLINSLDESNNLVEFDKSIERIVQSLASQAGIAIENMHYVEEIKKFFDSFVQVMATTIDERSPYNANHSKNIANLIEKFALYINKVNSGKYKDKHFSTSETNQLVTAAWLHDIGKVAVPLEVLDKPTRLGDTEENLMLRLNTIKYKLKSNYLEKCLSSTTFLDKESIQKSWESDNNFIDYARDLIIEVNKPSTFVDGELLEKLIEIKNKKFQDIDDMLLTDKDFENLSIVKGTLTSNERNVIESHVDVGERILSKMTFPDYLKNVPLWAISHHEFLDGTGYSKKESGDSIPVEVRMLTILDIFDALTAIDRPYKPGMPIEKALNILDIMATKEGKLDIDLVNIFKESKIWES